MLDTYESELSVIALDLFSMTELNGTKLRRKTQSTSGSTSVRQLGQHVPPDGRLAYAALHSAHPVQTLHNTLAKSITPRLHTDADKLWVF